MRILKLTSIVLTVLMLFSVVAFAGVASNDLIAFDDFESYGEVLTGWTTPTTYGNVSLVGTDKGISVKTQKTSSDGWHEVQRKFSETNASVSSIVYGCSIKFDGTPSMYFYTKSSAGGSNGNGAEKWITQIDNGKITVGSTRTDTAIIESGKWYDFFIEFNMQTGFTRCNITDGTNKWEVCDKPESFNALSKMFRISMALRAKTTLYFDNAFFSSLKYDVKPYAAENTVENFESFDPESSDDSWSIQGEAVTVEEIADSGRGKSIKLQSDGSDNLQLSKSLDSFSSTAKISFDIRASEEALVNFGFAGLGEEDASVAASYPVKISGGKLFADDSELDSFVADTWYSTALSLNVTAGTYSVTFSNGESSISGSGQLPEEIKKITSFDFLIPQGSSAVAYIDNVFVKNAENEGVCSYAPAYGTIGISASEFVVNFSDDIDTARAAEITATLGGVSVPSDKISVNGKLLSIIAPDAFDFGKTVRLEFAGVKLLDGGTYAGMQLYHVEQLCSVTDFAFSKTSLEPGELTGSANVSCANGNTNSALLIMILYDLETGNMVAHNFDTASVSETPAPLTATLTVPDDGGSYKAVMYLWDSMANMFALSNTLELYAQQEGVIQ